MKKEKELIKFFEDLASNIDDLEYCVQLCENNITSENAELSVIAMSSLRVFDEITMYLDYFDSEIAKKFGFVGLQEVERIRREVLEDFSEDIEEKDISLISERLEAVDGLIKRWDSLPKENETDIIDRAKSTRNTDKK